MKNVKKRAIFTAIMFGLMALPYLSTMANATVDTQATGTYCKDESGQHCDGAACNCYYKLTVTAPTC